MSLGEGRPRHKIAGALRTGCCFLHNKKPVSNRHRLLFAIFHYTARVTLPERRHLVQTYT